MPRLGCAGGRVCIKSFCQAYKRNFPFSLVTLLIGKAADFLRTKAI